MKNSVLVLVGFAVVLFSGCTNGQAQTGSNNLQATDFAQKIKELPGAPVVDVRTPEEFAKGHLPNAKNIDWNGNDFNAQISQLDKSKLIFVYCLSGGRSGQAAKQMRENGFTQVYELSGGIMKWRAANLPETNSNASVGMSKQQFDDLLNTDKSVLVDFYADWCGPCKKMKPYLEEIASDMKDKVMVVRINADDNQGLCKELKIDALPVLQLYKNKTLSWNYSGFIGKDSVVIQLK
jgi:thioredoxin